MKKEEYRPQKVTSLAEAHRAFGLPQPRHPLVSLLNGPHRHAEPGAFSRPHILGFYKISYKPKLGGKLKYGQTYYDFDEGGLLFASPGQIVGGNEMEANVCSAYTL